MISLKCNSERHEYDDAILNYVVNDDYSNLSEILDDVLVDFAYVSRKYALAQFEDYEEEFDIFEIDTNKKICRASIDFQANYSSDGACLIKFNIDDEFKKIVNDKIIIFEVAKEIDE